MGLITKVLKCGTIFALVVAMLIGSVIAGVPTKLGLYKWLAFSADNHRYIGLAPAFHAGIEWGMTFEELATIDLTGQTALVTGANAGLGYAMTMELARQGASVVMACRTDSKCTSAASKIIAETGNQQVSTMHLDTSSLASVRTFALDFSPQKLDMLFLNAGIGMSVGGAVSEDGIEKVFATNHVGHHLLTKLLMPQLRAAPTARIVLTSSSAHYSTVRWGVATDLATLNNKTFMRAYAQSKFAQILFAQELTRQLGPDSSIFINSFHPGAASSEIWDKSVGLSSLAFLMPVIEKLKAEFMWTCADGGLTGLYLAVKAHTDGVRGRYFHPQSYEVLPDARARDDNSLELQKALWAFSDKLVEDFV